VLKYTGVDEEEGLYTLHSVQPGAEAAGKDKHPVQKDTTRVQHQVIQNAVLRIRDKYKLY
jgi:hypothetical protein